MEPAPADPLIVTAAFDAAAARVFDDLRRQHFPAGRNQVPAHLTLFHNLPGEQMHTWLAAMREAAPTSGPAPFRTGALRFLGRGVAVAIDCPPLEAVRRQLAEAWRAVLTPQDRQPFRPHVTIQNKVAPADARALHERLMQSFAPVAGTIIGLDLWHYRGGPWEHAARCRWPA